MVVPTASRKAMKLKKLKRNTAHKLKSKSSKKKVKKPSEAENIPSTSKSYTKAKSEEVLKNKLRKLLQKNSQPTRKDEKLDNGPPVRTQLAVKSSAKKTIAGLFFENDADKKFVLKPPVEDETQGGNFVRIPPGNKKSKDGIVKDKLKHRTELTDEKIKPKVKKIKAQNMSEKIANIQKMKVKNNKYSNGDISDEDGPKLKEKLISNKQTKNKKKANIKNDRKIDDLNGETLNQRNIEKKNTSKVILGTKRKADGKKLKPIVAKKAKKLAKQENFKKPNAKPSIKVKKTSKIEKYVKQESNSDSDDSSYMKKLFEHYQSSSDSTAASECDDDEVESIYSEDDEINDLEEYEQTENDSDDQEERSKDDSDDKIYAEDDLSSGSNHDISNHYSSDSNSSESDDSSDTEISGPFLARTEKLQTVEREAKDLQPMVRYTANNVDVSSDLSDLQLSDDSFDLEDDSFDFEDYFDLSDGSDDLDDFFGESFSDDNSDTDYQLPDHVEEDVYIPQGQAKIYAIGRYNISFDSDVSAQIFEIPSEVMENKDQESGDSCPELVPIYPERHDSMEQKTPDFYETDETTDMDESEKNSSFESFEIDNTQSFHISEEESDEMDTSGSDNSDKDIENSDESADNQMDFLGSTRNSPHGSPDLKVELRNQQQTSISGDEKDSPEPTRNVNNSMKFEESSYQQQTSSSGDEKDCPDQRRNLKTSMEFEESTNDPENQLSDDLQKADAENQQTNEFSDNYEAEEDITETSRQLPVKFYNSFISQYVLLLLKKRIYFNGSIKATLIAGQAEAFGYDLQAGVTVELFSPRGYSFMYFEPKKGDRSNAQDLKKKFSNYKEYFFTSQWTEINETFDESSDALILLERNNDNNSVTFMKRYMKEAVFPQHMNLKPGSPFHDTEVILGCKFHLRPRNGLQYDPNWNGINIDRNTKLLVAGGKGVGKSTFVRYLINKNLNKHKKFLLIDLDIGQPEMFLPQTVSATIIDKPILGPGFFYCTKPEKAFMLGDFNILMMPITYMKIVFDLLNFCHNTKEFANIPWIINTMGYNKGFGSELIRCILLKLKPTDVIQIQSNREINNFDYILSSFNLKTIPIDIYVEETPENEQIVYNFYEQYSLLDNQSRTGEWNMSAKDKRFATILTRLGTILANSDQWLTDVPPCYASLDALSIEAFSDEDYTESELCDIINANLVYLCTKTEDSIECSGIGIVRGIDRLQRQIYIITSLPRQHLIDINCLAVSETPIPSSIILNQGPKVKGILPYTYNSQKSVNTKRVNQFTYRPVHFYNRGPNPKLQEFD